MKHVKLFKQFINEMKIGKTLFSRNAYQKKWGGRTSNKKYFMDLVSSMKDEDEFNTSD